MRSEWCNLVDNIYITYDIIVIHSLSIKINIYVTYVYIIIYISILIKNYNELITQLARFPIQRTFTYVSFSIKLNLIVM